MIYKEILWKGKKKKGKKGRADLKKPGVNKLVGERKQEDGITQECYIKAADV